MHQIEKELKEHPAGYYTREQIEHWVERLRDEYYKEYHSRNISLQMQVDALKKENDLIWQIYVEKIAEMKVEARLKEQL
jgi:outer membrane protein assembly factor BamA